ncbi:MAG TPA: hypothetical protein VEX64_06250 [Pyrinomonadaceae bacterium]|jgi:hypothetical protein|nr:hypothetical protein [Pyrinomonadaceae bacterium]
MSKVEILVKINDAYAAKMTEIAKHCRAAGMSVEQQMDSVGMISGTIERASIPKVERIRGVSYVEESRPIT